MRVRPVIEDPVGSTRIEHTSPRPALIGSGRVVEAERTIPIVQETDVLVIGGGSAGTAAAVCAAREGARVTLLERYSRLGGMATGGLVLLFDDMCDGNDKTVAGIVDEVIDRLVPIGGAVVSPKEVQFTPLVPSPESRKWISWGFEYPFWRGRPKVIAYDAVCDPEALVFVLQEMVAAEGVDLWLNTQFADVIMDDEDRVRGAIIESKEGRLAIEAKIVVDASGDGDVFYRAGAAFEPCRYSMSLVHRMGNVDVDGHMAWAEDHKDEAEQLNREMRRIYGGSERYWWFRTPVEGVVWCNCPTFRDLDGISTWTQTQVVLESRRIIQEAMAFARANIPGFQRAFLLETSNQVGVRQTRLLRGEYVLTKEDVTGRRSFPDRIGRGRDYFYPYRTLLPIGVENLIVTGRCFSATPNAHKTTRDIPGMFVIGQAAGTAAALALSSSTPLRNIDVSALQTRLVAQGVDLGPGPDEVYNPPTGA